MSSSKEKKTRAGMARKGKCKSRHGLSGLLLIFMLIALIVVLGSGAFMKMISIIFASNYNIPAQGSKIVAEMAEVCQGTAEDTRRLLPPDPFIKAQCDSCDTLTYKTVVRFATGAVEMALLWVKWPIGVIHGIYKGIRFGQKLTSGPTDPFSLMYGDKDDWENGRCVAKTLNESIGKILSESHLKIPIGIDQTLLFLHGGEEVQPSGGNADTIIIKEGIDVADKVQRLALGEEAIDPNNPGFSVSASSTAGHIDHAWKLLNHNLHEIFTISGDSAYGQILFSDEMAVSPTYTVMVSEEKVIPSDPEFMIAVTLRPEHAERLVKSINTFLESSFSRLSKRAGNLREGIYEAEIKSHARTALAEWSDVVRIVDRCADSMSLDGNPNVPPNSRDCWFPIVVGLYKMEPEMNSLRTIEQKLEQAIFTPWYGSAKGIAEEMSYQIYGKYTQSVDYFSQTPLEYEATTKLKQFDEKAHPDLVLSGDGMQQYHERLVKLRTRIFEVLKGSSDCTPEEFDFGTRGTIVSSNCAFITSCVYDDKIVRANEGCMLSAVNLDTSGFALGENNEFVTQMAVVPIIPITRGNVNTMQTYTAEAIGIVAGGGIAKALKTYGTRSKNCPGGDLNDKTIVFCLENKMPECDMPGLCQTCWSVTCSVKSWCDHATPQSRIIFEHTGSRFVVKGAVWPL